MLEPAIRDLATAKNFGTLSFHMPDGTIGSHVMWVDADDEHLLINTEVHRAKYRSIVADPDVTITIWDEASPYRYAEVRGRMVGEVRGPDGACSHRRLLAPPVHRRRLPATDPERARDPADRARAPAQPGAGLTVTDRILRTAVVVGNPRRGSRTSTVAVAVAAAVAARAQRTPEVTVVELADLGGALFDWGDPAVAGAKSTVLAADLLVVASPTFKASFTGLLKAFLDQFGRDELAAVPTVPTMVGAGPLHSLAVETQLRPILVEIGASTPTRGLYVEESQLDDLDGVLGSFLDVWGSVLIGAIDGRSAAMR